VLVVLLPDEECLPGTTRESPLILSSLLSGLITLHASKRAIAVTQSFLAYSLPVQNEAIALGKGKSTFYPLASSKLGSMRSLSLAVESRFSVS
jgi:hypothetical protein